MAERLFMQLHRWALYFRRGQSFKCSIRWFACSLLYVMLRRTWGEKKKNKCCENERRDIMKWQQCWLIAGELMLTNPIDMEKRRFLLLLRCVNLEGYIRFLFFALLTWLLGSVFFRSNGMNISVWSQGHRGSVDCSRRCSWQTWFQWQNAAFCCSRGVHIW